MRSLTFNQGNFFFSVDYQFTVKENLENFIWNKFILVPSIFCENFINIHANFSSKNDLNICCCSVPSLMAATVDISFLRIQQSMYLSTYISLLSLIIFFEFSHQR